MSRFLTPARCLLIALALPSPVALAVNCSLSVPAMTFPAYSVTSTSSTSVNVVLTCVKEAGDTTVGYSIRATAGSASFTRQMDANTDTTQLLNYNIYMDSTYTTIWGDTTGATNAPGGTFDFTALATGASLQATHTAYGLIPANQDLKADGYAPTTPPVNLRTRKIGGTGSPFLTGNVAMTVTATLPAFCAVDSASTMAFGIYDPLAAGNNDKSSNLATRCTKTTPYTITLSAGGAAAFNPRKLSYQGAFTDKLDYNLYTTNAYAAIWGDGTGGTSSVAGVGAGLLAAATANTAVWGRLFAGQSMAAGTYSDTITVTVSY